MEYKDWEKWEKDYPWLWSIVSNGHIAERTIVCKRTNQEIPIKRYQPFPDSRVWVACGANERRFRRPKVLEVTEIPWEAGRTIWEQARKLDWRSGLYGLYVVVGTIRPYPEGDDLTIYKRPHGIEDFRSLLY